MPRDGIDRMAYLNLKFGGSDNARSIYNDIRNAGASESLDFNFDAIQRMPNSLLSHRLIHYCRNTSYQGAVSENLFRSYFYYGIDISNLASLVNIAEESGLVSDDVYSYLSSDDDTELIIAQDKKYRDMGISGVPCFIINDEFVVSGAQESKVFMQVLDVAHKTQRNQP